jgi:hypothetical protein
VASSLTVAGFPTFITNGVSGSITVTAKDPAGNVVTNYTGTVHFTSSSAGSLPADYTFTAADQGSHTFSNVILTTTGTQSITATDQANGLSASQTAIAVHDAGASLIPVTDYRDMVYDPTRNLLYITATDGTVQRYDPATQTLLLPFQISGSLNGADITPDGNHLYVADRERNAVQGWFHDFNLTTGAVTNLAYNATAGSWDVAIGPDGIGLGDEMYEGLGPVSLEQITTASDRLTVRDDVPSGMWGKNLIDQDTMIARGTADGLFLLQGHDDSTGSIFLYQTGTDSFSSMHNSQFYGYGAPAVNRNDTLLAIVRAALCVFDANFNNVVNIRGLVGGCVFDPNQDLLYGVNAITDQIDAYDTNTWSLKYSIPVGEQVNSWQSFGPGTMAISSDSRYLFLGTQSGVRQYTLLQSTGLASSLSVTGFPSFLPSGAQGSLTVTVKDVAGNVVTGYRGTVHFSSTAAGSLPPDYTFTASDNGTHTFTLNLTSIGTQSISVSDQVNNLSGTQTGIVVHSSGTDYIPISNYSDLVYDPTRNLLYITTTDGSVQRYDVASQTLLTPFQVGVSLNGADITPDGSRLFAGDGTLGAVQGWFHDVNLSTGAVAHARFTFTPYDFVGGGWDVAIGSYGNAMIDETYMGLGDVPVNEITLADDSVTLRSFSSGVPTVGQNTLVARSADRSLFVFQEYGGDYAFTYSPATDKFSTPVAIGTRDFRTAVNRNGTLIAKAFANSPSNDDHGVIIYDPNFNVVATLTGIWGDIYFDPNRDVMYVGDILSNDLIAYDTNSWNVLYQLPLGETMGAGILGPGRMAVSNNGGLLFLGTPTKIRIFQTQPTLSVSGFPSNNPAGTPGHLTVTATLPPNGATETGYRGTVHFSSSDQQAGLPADYTFTAADNGSHTFSVTLKTAGSQAITVTDATNGLAGTQSGITVGPGTNDHLLFTVQPGNATAGSTFSPVVQAEVFDKYGNLETSDNSGQIKMAFGNNPGGGSLNGTTTQTVSGGVATFGDLSVDLAGIGYTLTATLGTLPVVTSATFNITPAAPEQLAFSVQPANSVAGGAISPAVKVQVLDQYGNLVSGDNSDQVTLSVASGPGGFASGSTTTVTVNSGVASFSNLILDTAGNYTLAESATGGLSGPASGSFSISPAAADHLAFSVQPSDSEPGYAISPAVKVKVFDGYGNFVFTDDGDQVTLSVASGPGGFTGGSTTTVTVSGGVATFGNLILATVGTYTLAENGSAGLTGPGSTSFNIVPPAADHLAFSVQPGNTTAGNAISPAVAVAVIDQFGHLFTADNSDQVTLKVASGPGSFASGSTTKVTVNGGIATFSNLILDTGGTYTLGQSATGGLSGPASGSFSISPAAADHLAFSVQPTPTTAGLAISPAIKVQLFDQYGNAVSGDNSDQVTLSVRSGPGGFAGGSTTTVTVSGGVATFSNVVFDTAGNYTLGENATGGLTGPASSSFTISPAAVDHLGFSVQPSNTQAGLAISPAVKVQTLDPYGNLVASDNSDQVTLTTASGPGGFTSGSTTTVTVSGGVATFSNLILDAAGDYTLAENATGGLSGTDSGSFTINPSAAHHLGFSVQPSNTSAGAAINPAVIVEVLDPYGNRVVSDSGRQVTLTVASGPGDFAAGSTTTMTVGGGTAVFNNLIFDTTGSYTLGEGATGGLTGPDSGSFTISPSGTDFLGFIVQPSNTTAGAAVSPAVQVAVFDEFGNLLSADNSDQVTLTVATGPGSFAGGSTTSATVSGGIATFNKLILDTAGSYTLAVSGTGGLSGPDSGSFTILPSTANHLGFTAGPSTTTAGVAISPAVSVSVLDQYGNVVSSDNSDRVTLSITAGPGGFASGSTTTVMVQGGVATFSNLLLDTAGSYALAEQGTSGLSGNNSNSFTVKAAAADHLAFSVQPSDTGAGIAISPNVKVQVFDTYGNLLTADNSDRVTLSVTSGPGGFTGGSTTTATVSGGIATFSNLVLNTAGAYTLGESATGGLTGAASNPFTVTPGAASHLGFGVPPGNTIAGAAISPAVKVYILDPYGNLVTTDSTDEVSVSVATGPAGFAAGSLLTVVASGGIGTFSSLFLDTVGSYTLGESATSNLKGPTSGSFTVSAAAPNKLSFSVPPSNTTAGVAISPAVQVKVFDKYGNLETADNSDQVALTVAGGPGGFAAGSTTTATVSGGIASFSNLILDTAGGYTLGESATGGLTGPSSGSFTIKAAAPDHLAFSVQPTTTTAGVAISPAVKVQVLDPYGNLETADNTDQVTLSVAGGPGSFAAGSQTTATVSNGVATFANLVLDTAGDYTLGASTSGGLTGPVSSGFTVLAAAADHLAFSVQPSDAMAGVAISPAVQVAVFDRYGNLLTLDNTDQVTLTVASGPGGFAAGSTTTVTVSAGTATFANLILDSAGSYTFAQTGAGGRTGPHSGSFTINPAAADHLAFSVQPAGATAGVAISPAVQVKVFDAYGNLLAADNSDQVTLSIAGGPGSFAAGSTTTATVSNGVATFGNLVLDTAGSYTLGASTSGAVTGADSSGFSVSPAAPDHLAFGVQPSDTTAGAAIGPAVSVNVFDRYGNLATNDNSDRVTLTAAGGPGDFASGSTTTAIVSGGAATFSTLILDTAGTYTLTENGTGGLAGPDSSSFTVSAGNALHQLAFSVQPSDTLAGSPITPTVQVQAFDPYGNLLTADNSDQVTLSVASGLAGFAPGSTTTATLNGGVATFSNLILDAAGSYTLAERATGGVTGPDSSSFTVRPALTADHLGFIVQPGNTTAGTAIRPAVQVAVFDPYGNLLTTDDSDQVTITVATGPAGFDSGSTTTVTVSGGIATFSNLILDAAGGYTLGESATGGVTGPDSGSFTISPAAVDHLTFSSQPGDTTAGTVISPAVQVQLFDRFGNLDTTDNADQVSMTIGLDPGGGTLGGTTTVTAHKGIATFANLAIDQAGSGYALSAALGGLRAGSTPFDVTAATATHLVIISQPADITAGNDFTVVVAALDNFGNVDPSFMGSVTITLAGNPGDSTLGGTLTVSASDGVATFSDLTLTVAGPGYPLEFFSAGLSSVQTPALDVSAAPATHLVVLSAPAGLLTAQIGFDVQIAAEDPFGNIDPAFTGTVGATLASAPSGGTLGGKVTTAAQSGVVSFTGLTLSQGGPYGLNFASGSLTPVNPSVTALAFQRSLPSVSQDATAPAGVTVSTLLASNYHDIDASNKPGIAVMATSGNGTWQYSSNGRRWSNIGNVSAVQARLLPASYQIRFVPALHWTGQASVIFAGWDGSRAQVGGLASTAPDGGTAAFSIAPAQGNVAVTPINHAPTWLPGSAALTPGTPGNVNPAGDSVTSIFAGSFRDVESGTAAGVAVAGLTGTSKGTWQYSTDGGADWLGFGNPSVTAVRLLSGNDLIRFLPSTTAGPGVVTLQAYAWDQTSGIDGQTANLQGKGKTGGRTAFSTTRLTAGFAINDAPALSSPNGPTLPATLEDVPSGGVGVNNLLTGESDSDPRARTGVAIVGQSGAGTWQYSLDSAHWQSVGTVSESLARLLPSAAQLRFLPALHQSGSATLTYRAWDQTGGSAGTLFAINGTGGAFAFSATQASASLLVIPINHAPAWTGSGPQLAPIVPGTGDPAGESIDSLFAGNFHDADAGTPAGVAVTGLTGTGAGSWQYQLAGDSVWQDFGPVSLGMAQLLSGLDQVRFVPAAGFSGTASLQAHAWDGTSGSDGDTANLLGPGATGGQAAFSATPLTARIAVHSAPTLASGTGPALPGNGAAVSVKTLLAGQGTGLKGVAVVGLSGAGTWQYSLDGKHWQNMGVPKHLLPVPSVARLLPSTALVRYLSGPHQSGQATLSYCAWDQSAGTAGSLVAAGPTGGATALSSTQATATLTVPAVHRAPVWTGSGAALTPVLTGAGNAAGDTVAAVFGAFFNVDVSGTTPGIAVTALTGSTSGVWQYSVDGGTTWLAFGSVSTKAARLLSGNDRIRFVPNAGFAGTVSLTAYAWDGTSGSDGGLATLSGPGKTGGGTAFSTTALTASCVVNTAPVLSS